MSAVIELIAKVLINLIGPNGENAGMVVILVLLFGLIFLVWLRTSKPIKRFEDVVLSYEVMRHQMGKTEEMIVTAEQMLLSNFMTMRKDILGDKEHLMDDGEVHRFRLIVKRVLHRVKKRMRFFFRENHLSEMSEREFDAHANARAKLIITEFTSAMNDEYWPGTQPTRTEVYDTQEVLAPKAEVMIKEAFSEGRRISVEMTSDKKIRSRHLRGLV